MKLGAIQRSVVSFLSRAPKHRAVICSTTKAAEFRGLDLEQVERALQGLIKRGIIQKKGILYRLVSDAEL